MTARPVLPARAKHEDTQPRQPQRMAATGVRADYHGSGYRVQPSDYGRRIPQRQPLSDFSDSRSHGNTYKARRTHRNGARLQKNSASGTSYRTNKESPANRKKRVLQGGGCSGWSTAAPRRAGGTDYISDSRSTHSSGNAKILQRFFANYLHISEKSRTFAIPNFTTAERLKYRFLFLPLYGTLTRKGGGVVKYPVFLRKGKFFIQNFTTMATIKVSECTAHLINAKAVLNQLTTELIEYINAGTVDGVFTDYQCKQLMETLILPIEKYIFDNITAEIANNVAETTNGDEITI